MIRIGAIKKMWKGWRVLLFAYVDDNSPLKSQYFVWETCKDKKEYIKVGKGVLNNEQRNYPVLKLYVPKWSICRYMFGGKSVVVFGIGKWDEELVSKNITVYDTRRNLHLRGVQVSKGERI